MGFASFNWPCQPIALPALLNSISGIVDYCSQIKVLNIYAIPAPDTFMKYLHAVRYRPMLQIPSDAMGAPLFAFPFYISVPITVKSTGK
jgi:hypothetical protein